MRPGIDNQRHEGDWTLVATFAADVEAAMTGGST